MWSSLSSAGHPRTRWGWTYWNRSTKFIEGVDCFTKWEADRAGVAQSGEEKPLRNLIYVYKYLREVGKEDGHRYFLSGTHNAQDKKQRAQIEMQEIPFKHKK